MNWTRDLVYGQNREKEFVALVPHLGLVPQNGLLEDFVDVNGNKWELKAERRTTKQTSNIAVEVVSSFKRQGAIYTAYKLGVKYIAYIFADNEIFMYDCEKLYFLARHVMRTTGTIEVYGSNAQVVLISRRRAAACQITF